MDIMGVFGKFLCWGVVGKEKEIGGFERSVDLVGVIDVFVVRYIYLYALASYRSHGVGRTSCGLGLPSHHYSLRLNITHSPDS